MKTKRPITMTAAKIAAVDTMHRAMWGDAQPVGKTAQIRCPSDVAEAARAYAARHTIPVSTIVGEALRRYLATHQD